MILAVQKYLRDGGTLDQLNNDLGIKLTYHPNDPLVILNYNQIDSPKTNEIVRECRGLTLELDTWKIIARSFSRFFNWGEVQDEMKYFNWNQSYAQEKCDGSLMVLYNFRGTWRVNTRGSFAEGECGFSGKSWSELFFEVVHPDLIEKNCRPEYSYVFEYCSLHNKVVRQYKTPQAFLLTVYSNRMNVECHTEVIDELAKELNCDRPELYNFTSIDEVIQYLKDRGEKDATFEGVVLCDNAGRRWKVKNPLYLSLHKMRGEDDNLFNPRYILPYVLAGEGDELLAYFNEVEDTFRELKNTVDSAYISLLELWDEVKDIESQKDFALKIIPRTKFSNILFQCRKTGKHPKEVWRNSENLILKVLCKS